MSQQITRKNHYVPEWYQRRFLSAGSNELFYLSLSPEKQLPDGRTIRYKEINRWSPSRCFCEQDLYTTQFGEILNDEVERLLMGSLDTKGAKAVCNGLVFCNTKLETLITLLPCFIFYRRNIA
jgi:hypothetical protein